VEIIVDRSNIVALRDKEQQAKANFKPRDQSRNKQPVTDEL